MEKLIIDGAERVIDVQEIDRFGFLVFNVIDACGQPVSQQSVPVEWFNSDTQTCITGGHTYTRIK